MNLENCKTGAKFCKWRTDFTNKEVLIEHCDFCNRKCVYKIGNGEFVDRSKFIHEHVRDFCQPFGPTKWVFIHVNGKEAFEKFQEMREEKELRKSKIDEYDYRFKEEVRSWKRSTFGMSGSGLLQTGG